MRALHVSTVNGGIGRAAAGVTAASAAVLATAVIALPAAASPAAAATASCQVTNATTHTVYPASTGASLQTAINAARAGDLINVKGVCVGSYQVAKNLTFVGLGPTNAVLQGKSGLAALTITSGRVSMTAFTLTHAAGAYGRGLLNSGHAFLYRVAIAGNTSAANGGGVLNNAELLLQRSTVSGNKSTGNGGGIVNNATLSLIRSTVSGNVSGNDGGGVWSKGTLTVLQSTVGANAAKWTGGGVLMTTPALFTASILNANNAGASGPDCAGPATSGGYNLIGTTDGGFCAITAVVGDRIGGSVYADAQLQPLANNGGPTQTMALVVTSPAVDVIAVGAKSADGKTTLCVPGETDQRLVTVPQGPACDVGAYELKV